MSVPRRVLAFALMAAMILGGVLVVGSSGAGAGPGALDGESGGVRFITARVAASEDTTLYAWFPMTNYSSEWNLTLRAGDTASPILKFDLASIPYPAQVEVAQATLKVWPRSRTNASGIWATVYAVNRPWRASQATWNSATSDTNWALPGCNGVPGDRAGTGTAPANITELQKWASFDVTDIVQGWFDGSLANNGLVVKALRGDAVGYSFASVDDIDPNVRPLLQIVYATLPTPTPTPIVPELEITKTGPIGPFYDPSVDIRYEIVVSNKGTRDASGVVVTDVLPLGTVFDSCTGGGVNDRNLHTVVWTAPTLNVGPENALTLEVSVHLADWVKATGNIVNVASTSCEVCVGGLKVSAWPIVIGPSSPTPTPTRHILYLTAIYK